MDKVETLKQDLLSKDKALILNASKRLSKIGINAVKDILIPLLDNENPLLRNKAALALGDIGNNIAIEPLFNAINKKENYHYNGTLVHALFYLNCSKKIVDLFDILFFHEYEPRIGAVAILKKQAFVFTDKDLKSIQKKWNNIKTHPDKCPEYNEVKDDIEYLVNGFITYLNENKTSP